MNGRRSFLNAAWAVAVPAAAAIVSTGVANGQDGNGNVKDIMGSWNSIHTLPFPPGQFREFLRFADDGGVHETNSFLHTASNLDFSMFGLPNVVNGADGVGSWTRAGHRSIDVVFRKLLFNGSRVNFGDLHVTGTVTTNGDKLQANWHIMVVDPTDKVLLDFGQATSEGVRLR